MHIHTSVTISVHIHTSVTISDFGLVCQKASNGGLLIQENGRKTNPSVHELGRKEQQKASNPLCGHSNGTQPPTCGGLLFLSAFSFQWGQRVVNYHLFLLAADLVGCKILVPQSNLGLWPIVSDAAGQPHSDDSRLLAGNSAA